MKKTIIVIICIVLVVLVAIGGFILFRAEKTPVERFGSLLSRQGIDKPNILFITLDTTRADRLGCYGYKNAGTPHLDRLADSGVLFEQCISPTPLTLPSHACMMTGLLPTFHGVRINGDNALSFKHQTLAELLARKGYACGAFIAAFVLDGRWGLKQGFHHYDDRFNLRKYKQLDFARVQRPGNEIVDSAFVWLEKQKDQPFFAWIHLYDPHHPYEPPEPYFSRYKNGGASTLYDGEIAFTDEQVGRCVTWLEERGLDKNTIIVVMGDHGEGLGSHGEATHGYYIYDYAIQVPFIIKTPFKRLRGLRIAQQVRTIDIYPTLLEIAGIPFPRENQGISLLPLLFEPEHQELIPYVYSESMVPELQCGWSSLHSLRTSKYKYIDAPKPELYDLSVDPGEKNNLRLRRPKIIKKFKKELERIIEETGKGAPAPEAANLDRETLKRLATLGYIGTQTGTRKGKKSNIDPKDRFDIYKKISMANEYIGEEDYPRAAEILETILKEDPANPQIKLLLATCYIQLNRPGQAKQQLDSILKKEPDNVKALIRIAEILSEEGKNQDVVTICKKALSVDSQNTLAHMLLGKVYMEENQYEKALPFLRKAVEIQPKLSQNRQNLAICLLNLNQYDETEKILKSITQEDKDFPMAHFHLGLLYEKTGRIPEAKDAYRQELTLDETSVPTRFNYGSLLFKLGDRKGYIEQMRQIIKLDPQSCRGYLFLARGLLYEDVDLDHVIELVQKGISLAKESRMKAFGYYLLADIYSRKKQPAKVKEALEKAKGSATPPSRSRS